MRYEIKKVFDCQDMSVDLRKTFFDMYDTKGNDTYVNFCIEEGLEPECYGESGVKIAKWLVDNGASKDDEVLISHWW